MKAFRAALSTLRTAGARAEARAAADLPPGLRPLVVQPAARLADSDSPVPQAVRSAGRCEQRGPSTTTRSNGSSGSWTPGRLGSTKLVVSRSASCSTASALKWSRRATASTPSSPWSPMGPAPPPTTEEAYRTTDHRQLRGRSNTAVSSCMSSTSSAGRSRSCAVARRTKACRSACRSLPNRGEKTWLWRSLRCWRLSWVAGARPARRSSIRARPTKPVDATVVSLPNGSFRCYAGTNNPHLIARSP